MTVMEIMFVLTLIAVILLFIGFLKSDIEYRRGERKLREFDAETSRILNDWMAKIEDDHLAVIAARLDRFGIEDSDEA